MQETNLNMFMSLIEEVLEERDYQKESERIKKHSKMRMSTKGPKVKTAPFDEDPPSGRSKSAPPLGEDGGHSEEEDEGL